MTFDFATFLVCAKTLGADHVHFRHTGKLQASKFGAEVAWKRFDNIVLPLCELAGVTHSIGPGDGGITPSYHYGTAEALYKKLGRIWKFPMLEGPGGYITVTLRDSFRNKHKNSGREWLDFVERSKRDVVVLHECELDPMPIAERMKLYANAEMNFGVNNGPNVLAHLSDAPYRTFMGSMNENDRMHHKKTGFPVGSQFSFKNDRQMLIWKPVSIMDHLEDT